MPPASRKRRRKRSPKGLPSRPGKIFLNSFYRTTVAALGLAAAIAAGICCLRSPAGASARPLRQDDSATAAASRVPAALPQPADVACDEAATAGQVRPLRYADLAATGKLDIIPYVWERSAQGKHLAVIGTRHTRRLDSPMFDRMETIFARVRPQLLLHESEVSEGLLTAPRAQAIASGADLGFAVYLAGRYGATVRSGDAPDRLQFAALLACYPAEDVLVFFTAQRLIGSVRRPNVAAAQDEYPRFYAGYLLAQGLPGRPHWRTWDGFLAAYQRVVGRRFTSRRWNPDLLNPIRDIGRLNRMARTLDTFRDRHLLAAIRRAMRDNDRVVVVFGGWHVLALEPLLGDTLPDPIQESKK
jgi:hypothetical protein